MEQFLVDGLAVEEEEGEVVLDLVEGDLLAEVLAQEELLVFLAVVELGHHAVDAEAVAVGGRALELHV